jgi:uncharacterized membrane protein
MSTPETGGPQETPSSGDLPRSPDQRPAGATEPPTGPRHQPQANGLAIAAIVFGVGAVFFMPIILGPIGIILAVMARSRGQSLANVGLTVAIVGTALGLIFGIIAAMTMENDLALATLLGAYR